MQARPLSAKLILAAFVAAALFGVYGMVSLSHTEHSGCPVSSIQHSLCATPLEHLSHWQGVFTAVLVEILALFVFVALFSTATTPVANTLSHALWRRREHAPPRPTALQELFAQGILHRKEPRVA